MQREQDGYNQSTSDFSIKIIKNLSYYKESIMLKKLLNYRTHFESIDSELVYRLSNICDDSSEEVDGDINKNESKTVNRVFESKYCD